MDQLHRGLILLALKQTVAEPEYYAINRVTFTSSVVDMRNNYAGEIVRVLDELKLTTELLGAVESQSGVVGRRQPEEIVNYYNGVFLDLVHQLKDKVFQLIGSMIAEIPRTARYQELSSKQIGKLIAQNQGLLSEIGVYDLLTPWQEDASSVGVVLARRTQHHHKRSRLELNELFQKAKTARILLQPGSAEQLSEYGKQWAAKTAEESFNQLKTDTLAKQKQSIEVIEANLNALCEKLIGHYKVPTDAETKLQIVADYWLMLTSLEIKNEAAKEKITPELLAMVDKMLKTPELLREQLVSVYLVGSVGRGEFLPGSSDINFIIVTKRHSIAFDTALPVTTTFVGEDEFASSDKYQKERFICWSDGVLLSGKEFKFRASDFPKPGTLLCLLLNRGVIERIEKLKSDVVGLKHPGDATLRIYCLKAAKIMMDYLFGVAMSNKPYYTASRRKKLDYIKENLNSSGFVDVLEKIYLGKGILSQKDFAEFIDAFMANARSSYAHLLKLEAEFTKPEPNKASEA